MTEKDKAFTYSYSSKQQEEINAIRKKYMPAENDKMQQLRRLDEGVTRKAMAVSLSVGVIGAFLLGIGMCCTMVWADKYFVIGIIVGVIGIGFIAGAYPIYSYVIKKERRKIAPQIIKLTDELTQDKQRR
ncbi:MAG: hypothetical protein ACI4IE_08330 [Eubacterium sp.]